MGAGVIMVQGTSSHVGKSVIVTGLCRIFRQDGYSVAPFKAQNISLNSYVTLDGGEIARAQAVQAEAACVEPTVYMNPILLKPSADFGSQVIVLGKPVANMTLKEYYGFRRRAIEVIRDSLKRLIGLYDIVVIEGAGSPAEVNLRRHDIANMRVAHLLGAPVLLVGDIDRGGVFASIIGTLELLSSRDKRLIKGFIINKFRGDVNLLRPGVDFLERKTGKRVFGVIPYFNDIVIDEEDSVSLENRAGLNSSSSGIVVGVIRLPRISNFTDFSPLERERGVVVRYIVRKEELDGVDAIVLPGTKSTIADLIYLKNSGMAERILKMAGDVPIIGICGGYQMLGRLIVDEEGVESSYHKTEGLGLLDMVTVFNREKVLKRTRAVVLDGGELFKGLEGQVISGYEIHMGRSFLGSSDKPFLKLLREGFELDGAVSRDMPVYGTYLHGVFENENLRSAFVKSLARKKRLHNQETKGDLPSREEAYNRLAELLRNNLDMEGIYGLIKGRGKQTFPYKV
jgi:adenosylcobyric acid synthase